MTSDSIILIKIWTRGDTYWIVACELLLKTVIRMFTWLQCNSGFMLW